MANIARRKNQADESLKQIQAALKLKPDNAEANAMLFNHYLWQRQWDAAEAMLEPLSRNNMDQSGGLLYRYRLAMAKEEYQSAVNFGQQLTQRMPEFGQSWLALAQAQQAMGQYEEALKNYNEALLKQSDNGEAMRGSVECYYALNKPNEARTRIRDARRAMPANSYFQELEINHELTYGDPAKAIPPREEQLKRNPDRMQNVLALGQAYMQTARSYIGKPEKSAEIGPLFAKARDQFRTGLTKWPDEIVFYAHYAETAARSGEIGDSEQILKQLASREKWKDKVEPQMLLAEFYGVTKRYAESETALRNILAKEPKNTQVQIRLANLLFNQNKIDDAINALEANSDETVIARRKVEILLNSGRIEEADKALESMLARTPSNLEILQLAASVQISRAKFPEAEAKLNRAFEIDANNPTTHYFMGLLRMNQPKADIAKAMEHLTKGKSSPTMGIDARFALSECLRRQSNVDGAIRELESALQSQPTNKRVRLALIAAYLGLQPPRTVDAERTIADGKRIPGMADDPDLMQHEVTILASKDPKKAADLISKVLAANPNDKAVQRKSLELLLKSGNYKEVNARVAEIVQKDDTAWWAYQSRAVASRYLGRKDEAIKDFEAALEATNKLKDDFAANDVITTMGDVIGPDEAITRIRPRVDQPGGEKWQIMIARLQQNKGDTQTAIKTLEGVLAREGDLTREDKLNAYRFGGTLYLMVANAQKSSDCYKKLLDLAPEDMTALNNLACLLAEVVQPPNPQEGLKYSQRAYDLMMKGGRRDPLVLDTHGWLLVLSGRVDEGTEVLRSALQLRRIPDAHYHLGEAYLKKKFADQALTELDLALSLYRKMKEEKQPVDPALEGKIENALTRANIEARSKKSTANAPTGQNVP
jgi:tetratricopeptide (TPR) repeat protein